MSGQRQPKFSYTKEADGTYVVRLGDGDTRRFTSIAAVWEAVDAFDAQPRYALAA